MPVSKNAVKIEGLAELQRELKKAGEGDVSKAVRKANRDAAALARDQARQEIAPKSVTGNLQRSVKSAATQDRAKVTVGDKTKVPYAGPVHFGWPARNIVRPNRFVYRALAKKREEIRDAYEKGVDAALAPLRD